jgi:lipopolysaccharide transport system ATP-binding protein
MAIIEVNHVSKEFQLGQFRSLKQTALDAFARLCRHPVPERAPFKALADVDFKVEKGEVLGIIGHNGAGKSTLLKLLAGISEPTHGSIIVGGKVAPLIEVGAGLVPDLTGRENIRLNALILGLKRSEVARKFDDIVSFAELEEFIDTPVKRYSTGMRVRLGFSIATIVDSEILVVDEVLAVGDLAFQRKCFDRMEEMIKRQGKTVLLVSHNIRQVERMCSRVILLDHGTVASDGDPTDVCNLFINDSNQKIQATQRGNAKRHLVVSEEAEFQAIEVLDERGAPTEAVEFLHSMRIKVTFDAKIPLRQMTFYIGLHTTDFVYLTAHNTAYEPVDLAKGRHYAELEIKSVTLLPGVYCVLAWIGAPGGRTVFHGESLCTFRVFARDYGVTRQRDRALFHMDAMWHVDAEAQVVPDTTA